MRGASGALAREDSAGEVQPGVRGDALWPCLPPSFGADVGSPMRPERAAVPLLVGDSPGQSPQPRGG